MCPAVGTASREREPVLDLKKLSPGEMTTAISGVLLLVFSFFAWFGVDYLGGTFTRNGWQAPKAFLSIVAILLGIVLAAHVIVEKLSNVELPERLGSVGWGVMHLAGGGIAFLFVLLKAIFGGDYFTVSLDRKFGLWIGLLASLGLLVGGYLMAKEAGELPSALGGGTKDGGATPPPA
jgi:hypothetical protein